MMKPGDIVLVRFGKKDATRAKLVTENKGGWVVKRWSSSAGVWGPPIWVERHRVLEKIERHNL